MIPAQIENYHKFNDLVRNGDFYRIASFRENNIFDCVQIVSKDRKDPIDTSLPSQFRSCVLHKGKPADTITAAFP